MRPVGWLVMLVCLAVSAGCTGECTNCVTPTDGGGCTTCVPDGGRFAIFVIDGTNFSVPDGGTQVLADGGPVQSSVSGYETIPLFQIQLAPNGNIGIAYVEFSADQTDNKAVDDPSVLNYDILYSEFSNSTGAVVLGPERVTGDVPVQNYVGVSLDYYNGEPVVGLLGWAAAPGYDSTQAYWYQHNAVVSYRNLNGAASPGAWTEVTVESNPGNPGIDQASTGTACGEDGSCSEGSITGLYPAVFVDGSETILAYRNVHFGSSTGTGDFDNSNFDIGFGGPSSWSYFGLAWGKPGIPLPLSPAQPATSRGCATSTGRTAYGDHSRFIHGDSNNPVLISDIGGNEYNTYGTDVIFFERQNGTTWNCPLSIVKLQDDGVVAQNLQETGPSIAYDSQGLGYAVAVSDISGTGAAYFKTCNPALAGGCTTIGNWTEFQTVFQSGSGGYFSSVALNPDTHDPWVAYYYCSASSSYNEFSCPKAERLLQVATSPGNIGIWRPEAVDTQGAWQTQMLYLTNPSTQLVIGYRDPTTGAMKLAVENPE
jgi:hypothetical protein